MHHLIPGINFLSHSASLVQNTLLMMSHLQITSHLLTTLTLHHTFSVSFQAQNSPFPQIVSTSLLAPTWTAFSDYTGPDLLGSTVFHRSLCPNCRAFHTNVEAYQICQKFIRFDSDSDWGCFRGCAISSSLGAPF